MKTIKLKSWLMIGMMSIGVVGINSAFAGDDSPKSIEDNHLSNRKEYKEMKIALKLIERDKMRIDYHRDQVKVNRGADDFVAKNISKKELRKAKADLRHDKKYLKTNKKDLKSDQKVAIKQQKKDVRATKKELRKAKWDLQKELWFGDAGVTDLEVTRVNFLSEKLKKQHKETLALEKDVDEFFTYLDDKIEETF